MSEPPAHLREAAARIARLGARPAPPHDRLTEMEKVSAKLSVSGARGSEGRNRTPEPWAAIAARLDFADLVAARPRDVRLALDQIWRHEDFNDRASTLVSHGLQAHRKTYDRELLLAYLRHFPLDHPAFKTLTSAAGTAAVRHDWPWQDRGQRYHLWDADAGPDTVGQALLVATDPAAVLADAGLDGDLTAGLFVEDALDAVCEQVGRMRGPDAEASGLRLKAVFEALPLGGDTAMLAYGLLNPWLHQSPSEDYRSMVGEALIDWIGDPRTQSTLWSAIKAELAARELDCDAEAIIGLLKNWLTRDTVKQFFKLVGRVTNDPKQWAAREEFWLAYLDAGSISEAWFAFGRQAEYLAQAFDQSRGRRFGEITGGGADPTHSALILSIGDIRIAEWSHNGACRFWSSADPQAPALYEKQYFGMQLRAMNGGRGFTDRFEAIPHTSGWQANFSQFVYRHTGIRHTRWQEGYRSRGSRP